jgi:hypothetical protein
VSRSCACIGSPCLRHCGHGVSIGGGGGGGGVSRAEVDLAFVRGIALASKQARADINGLMSTDD